MKISFDPAKDIANVEKHGCSLALTTQMEWDDALIVADDRKDYGEDRQVGIGYIGLRLYVTVFTDRAEERRVISLRKANLREVKRYAEA